MYASQTKEYGISLKLKYLLFWSTKNISLRKEICLIQVEEYVKENTIISKLKACIKTISFVLLIWFEPDFNSKSQKYLETCV